MQHPEYNDLFDEFCQILLYHALQSDRDRFKSKYNGFQKAFIWNKHERNKVYVNTVDVSKRIGEFCKKWGLTLDEVNELLTEVWPTVEKALIELEGENSPSLARINSDFKFGVIEVER